MKLVRNSSTSIGTNTRLQNLVHTAGADTWMRVQVVGTNPTTLRMKAWRAGDQEPATWGYVATDSQPEASVPRKHGDIFDPGSWDDQCPGDTLDR